MTKPLFVRLAAVGASTASLLAFTTVPSNAHAPALRTGPNTTTAPYVLPAASGVEITSLLAVGDAAGNGYRYVGIPDGMGRRWENGKVVAYSNHELQSNRGIVRAHGAKGAFVSKWTIDPETNQVAKGEDFMKSVVFWNYATGQYSSTPSPAWTNKDGTTAAAQVKEFNRFCSGSLSDPLQFLSKRTLRGYADQIYFANEEAGDEGRVFGVTPDGTAYQLPRLGLLSWENTLVGATRGDTTLVMGDEDGGSGQLRAYVGTKQYTGTPWDKAGLTNGTLNVIDAVDPAVTNDVQFRATYGKHNPAPVQLNPIDWTQGGAAQNAEAAAKGLSLNRIEDGAWDPSHRNDYYFVTTEGGVGATVSTDPVTGAGNGRDGGGLWRLRYADVDRPELGGTLELLLDGSESIGLNKPDNMTIDKKGNLLLQEDPGNNVHVSRVVAYRIADGALGVVAQFDPARFSRDAAIANPPEFLTLDEESSGIITAREQFGSNTFLFDAQVHTAKNLPAGTGPGTVEEYVENGQLLLLRVRRWRDVYGSAAPNGADADE